VPLRELPRRRERANIDQVGDLVILQHRQHFIEVTRRMPYRTDAIRHPAASPEQVAVSQCQVAETGSGDIPANIFSAAMHVTLYTTSSARVFPLRWVLPYLDGALRRGHPRGSIPAGCLRRRRRGRETTPSSGLAGNAAVGDGGPAHRDPWRASSCT